LYWSSGIVVNRKYAYLIASFSLERTKDMDILINNLFILEKLLNYYIKQYIYLKKNFFLIIINKIKDKYNKTK